MIGGVDLRSFEGDVFQLDFAQFEGGRLTIVYWVDDAGRFYGQFAFEPQSNKTGPRQGWTGIDADTQEFEFRGGRFRLVCPQTQPAFQTCHIQKLEWNSKRMQNARRIQKAKKGGGS